MKSRRSILDQLRKRFPGDWKAVREKGNFGWSWIGPIGTVRSYSVLTPKFDDDDESCISVYMVDGKELGRGGMLWSS